MAKLIATSPCAGLLPIIVGPFELTERVHDRITSVAPLKGQSNAVSAELKVALGLGFPEPNKVTRKGSYRAIWIGGDQALVFDGDVPDLTGQAAVTDQTDGWAVVRISGPRVEDVLARLVPVDLRPNAFPPKSTARTLIGHMTGSVTRTGANAFDVMVMRSMAGTLVHDLSEAAKGVAARR